MKLRKLLVTMACAGTVVATPARALDLGAITVDSAAGEPLRAAIALQDAEEVKADTVTLRILGVDGLPVQDARSDLAGVKATLVEAGGKLTGIGLASSIPYERSYLGFLLEVKWPEGRLLREYTALLNAPAGGVATAPSAPLQQEMPIQTAKVAPVPSSQVKLSAAPVEVAKAVKMPQPARVAEPAAPIAAEQKRLAEASPQPELASAAAIIVGSKETLWDIALRNRLNETHSNQQMMLALFRKNPEAFANGNINALRGGARLALPDQTEVALYSEHDALVAIRAMLKAGRESHGRPVTRVEKVVVGPKQTLWDLVISNRYDSSIDARQLMLAIVKKNPHAFDDGSINRMHRGAALVMPNFDEYNAVSAATALVEVRRQIAQRQAQPDSVQLDNTESSPPRIASPAPPIRVGAKETLWSIAVSHLPSEDVRVGDMIKAIIRKNPEAFTNGDMHTMRVGATLEMPDRNEIAAVQAH